MRIFRSLRLLANWLFSRSESEADLDAEFKDYVERQTNITLPLDSQLTKPIPRRYAMPVELSR